MRLTKFNEAPEQSYKSLCTHKPKGLKNKALINMCHMKIK